MHIYFWIDDNPKFTDFNQKNYPHIENKYINNNNNDTTAATSGSKHTKDNVIFEV